MTLLRKSGVLKILVREANFQILERSCDDAAAKKSSSERAFSAHLRSCALLRI